LYAVALFLKDGMPEGAEEEEKGKDIGGSYPIFNPMKPKFSPAGQKVH
jgi:hypothetical protein